MKRLDKILAFLTIVLAIIVVNAQNKQVTICWDASYSMQDRDLDREFYFLDAYFKTIQDADVTILTFSDKILSKDNFIVTDGDWNSIQKRLKETSYDGATSYEALGDYTDNGEVLLFTDGHQNMGAATPNFSGELFLINGKKDYDKSMINLLAIVNNANVINLLDNRNIQNPKEGFKEYLGTIYNGTQGLSNATVYIKGTDESPVRSNSDGTFKIYANPSDTLVVSVMGKAKEHILDDELNVNFIFEDNDAVALNEVIVAAEGKEEQELVTTAYGLENKDKIGYAVQSITDKDIADVSYTANNAVQGKFSGVRLGQNDDLSQVTMRPSNSILGNNYGLIVIDGVPMSQTKTASFVSPTAYNNDAAPITVINNARFIDPKNIAKITVLKGLAATNRYGSMGANGVLMITTKTATVDGSSDGPKDLARLQNNIYDGKIKVSSKTLVTPYLKELKKGKNLQEAYNIYLNQRETYWKDSGYLLDVYEFFYASSPEIAERILSNILEKREPKYEELRGMFLKSSGNGNHNKALLAAHSMVERFPNRIQSYLDLALAERANENYQEALEILNGILTGQINTSLNFIGLEKIAGTEIRNLINTQRKDLDISKVDPKYHNNLTYNARLVLEWNDSDADFIVQFVNPQKRFFNWEHTELADRNRILDELQHGFSGEQFEIFGADTKGDWLLNVSYGGNRTSGNKAPTFIKCTVQYNFGSLDQREEEFLVRLQEVDEEQQLAKFTVQ
ncbi:MULTISPECIES: TonB-dependent receptor plug domain-containing protein [Flavobacteriaceae]|uniref:TonB-dependent receptor plug domain-containing protein n=1 Tax=Flavobacteriaceae TaxID=49546 RepID=UPI0014917380|nr:MULTISPECIES: TonB-dependent receptor plug domain-containing protein [Allomuricauda]MDC6364499.1 TonB-dependent receptor plug domain-containing protein [Muricauda sp. AC10]